MKKVNNIEHLKQLVDAEQNEFVVLLNGGFRSSKHITHDGEDKWWVLNYIDDTEDEFTTKELMESTVGKALVNGALYVEE